MGILAECLTQVEDIPHENMTIFGDFILPELFNLTKDPEVNVRKAVATHIAQYARRAKRFSTAMKAVCLVSSSFYCCCKGSFVRIHLHSGLVKTIIF